MRAIEKIRQYAEVKGFYLGAIEVVERNLRVTQYGYTEATEIVPLLSLTEEREGEVTTSEVLGLFAGGDLNMWYTPFCFGFLFQEETEYDDGEKERSTHFLPFSREFKELLEELGVNFCYPELLELPKTWKD